MRLLIKVFRLRFYYIIALHLDVKGATEQDLDSDNIVTQSNSKISFHEAETK